MVLNLVHVTALFTLISFKPVVSVIPVTLSCGESTSGNDTNFPVDVTFTAGSDPIIFSTCNSEASRDGYLYYGGTTCNPATNSNPNGCTTCGVTHETWTRTYSPGQHIIQFYWFGGSGKTYYQIDMNCPTVAPTYNPSVTPTNNPTRIPTTTPTVPGQTLNPTQSPTNNPTNIPTATPTNTPSNDPTKRPTDGPTESPTDYAFCTDNTANVNAGFVTLDSWSNVICEFCVCRDNVISELLCDVIDFNNLKSYDSYLIEKFMKTCGLDQECSFKQVVLKRPSDDITECNCDLFQCDPRANNANTFIFGILVVLQGIIVMFL